MNDLLKQIKQRRLALNLKQSDMLLKVGISRQQYQRLEAKGNPRMDTLTLIAQGLNSDILLIPKEKLAEVKRILSEVTEKEKKRPLNEDPWQGLLGDDDD